jgi:hypothetical protein
MIGDEWISVICEWSDLVGVTEVTVAKRCFCRSRTDNRGFDLIKHCFFYKNQTKN